MNHIKNDKYFQGNRREPKRNRIKATAEQRTGNNHIHIDIFIKLNLNFTSLVYLFAVLCFFCENYLILFLVNIVCYISPEINGISYFKFNKLCMQFFLCRLMGFFLIHIYTKTFFKSIPVL